jgi:hypothetical protein
VTLWGEMDIGLNKNMNIMNFYFMDMVKLLGLPNFAVRYKGNVLSGSAVETIPKYSSVFFLQSISLRRNIFCSLHLESKF